MGKPGPKPRRHLSDDEMYVLERASHGRKISEIAVELSMSPQSANHVRMGVLRRMRARTLTEAVYLAAKEGII